MNASSYYEAASEIRGAIVDLDKTVAEGLDELKEETACLSFTRVELWAGLIFAARLREVKGSVVTGGGKASQAAVEAAATAWTLADALEQANPANKQAVNVPAGAGPAEDNMPIDLGDDMRDRPEKRP